MNTQEPTPLATAARAIDAAHRTHVQMEDAQHLAYDASKDAHVMALVTVADAMARGFTMQTVALLEHALATAKGLQRPVVAPAPVAPPAPPTARFAISAGAKPQRFKPTTARVYGAKKKGKK